MELYSAVVLSKRLWIRSLKHVVELLGHNSVKKG